MYYGIKDIFRDHQKDYLNLRPKEFWALQDINVDLYEGEILGIVGANGSGKSSLMRIISGIYPVGVGRILGKPEHKITSIFALGVGMQSLFTGRENIYIKAAMYGMSKEEIDAKIPFIEEFSELGDRLDNPFGNYSSGMRARLSYSIALATDPNIFIIDEALAVGDSVFKAKCFDNLKEFVEKPDRAVLFVSNNVRKILKIADRVVILDQSKLIRESTDLKDALNFYILNCLKDEKELVRKRKLKAVQNYDF
jgi:lipopolysaccharide transport system ATP-binding protein